MEFNKPLKIALGDLRHSTIGKHSIYMPLNIAYIGSFLLSQFEPESIDLRLYTEIDQLSTDIEEWKPDVIGLSNYCWNSSVSLRISRFAKEKLSRALCVMGGPEFPSDIEERREYLSERPEIDVYVYGNGEAAFVSLIKAFCKNGLDIEMLKSNPVDGTTSINPKTGNIITGKTAQRFRNMDIIPSPYLNGLLDKWLIREDFIPTIQTTRGCPFKCGYCHTGQNVNDIDAFSVQRIKNELTYIAKKIKDSHIKRLGIVDTNFGMYPRDLEIANHLAMLMDEYNWPLSLGTEGVGKRNLDRVLTISKQLKNRMNVGLSLQSLNPETCKVVKRVNMPMEQYLTVLDEVKKLGQKAVCELIIPMPEETKKSYFEGQKILIEAGVNTGTYTTMLLKGTLLASKEYREKYKMKTKYRIIPRMFGEYIGEKCFEIEEVCVETNTMSFNDYIDCRCFSFVVELFTSAQFDIIHRHLKELKLSFYEYIKKVWLTVKSGNVCLSKIYNGFQKEAQEELFDSKNAIYEYFSMPENYQKLLNAEIGDNLLRKYMTKAFFVDWPQLIDFAYNTIEKISDRNFSQEIIESLNAAKQWVLAIRDINTLFCNNESIIEKVDMLSLPYDVFPWYMSPDDTVPLTEYKKISKYKISYDERQIVQTLDHCKSFWRGIDKEFQLGNMLMQGWQLKNLWKTCTPE